MTTFNQRIKQAREDAGMALDDVLVAVKTQLPEPIQASRSTIGRLETVTAEDKADPFLVQFLCTLYGVELADISPIAAKALDDYAKIIDLRRENPRLTTGQRENPRPDDGLSAYGWTSAMGLSAHGNEVIESPQRVLAGVR